MAGFPNRISTQIYAIAAIIPIWLYNGEKRNRNPAVQWGFNLFYPLHLTVMLLIRGI